MLTVYCMQRVREEASGSWRNNVLQEIQIKAAPEEPEKHKSEESNILFDYIMLKTLL